jgi:hypothetical protein
LLAVAFVSASKSGGQPTGTTACATDARINEVASPSRKICTLCPASASALPCRNAKAALVGSSEPQALLNMILRGFFGSSAVAAAAPAKIGRKASRESKPRRSMVVSWLEEW